MMKFLAGCYSSKIIKYPFIERILGFNLIFQRLWVSQSLHAYVGWGRRPTIALAKYLANKKQIPFITLEDGFLRSFLPGNKSAPLSFVLDKSGIYYDSFASNDLESLLNIDMALPKNKSLIRSLKKSLISNCLSKYNHAPGFVVKSPMTRNSCGLKVKEILVVDQTFDDMSVSLGSANAETFNKMLSSALIENPSSTVYVKTHPEVTSGSKRGYLTDIKDTKRIVMIRGHVNPISLIKKMDKVYVVTSQMGFEALMCQKPVVCFGVPWYAGWGLTDDRVRDSSAWVRRIKKRTLDELFYAAYIKYTYYLNPITHQKGQILDVVDWLIHQKKINAKFFPGFEKGINQGRMIGYKFPRWRKFNIKHLFSIHPDRVVFVNQVKALHRLRLRRDDRIVLWGNEIPDELVGILKNKKDSIFYVEDGFIRSAGLGSDLVRPLSLVFDHKGIYFDATKPSDLETILNKKDFTDDELEDAKKIKRLIIQHQITKYNIDEDIKAKWKASRKKIILIPGQVEDDASIKFGSFWIQSNLNLLEEVRIRNPNAYIVYKPHPDVSSGNRSGTLKDEDVLQYADYIERKASVINSIESSDEIHTMTSLTGFDALIRGKKVVTYGEPFYSGWGLTTDLYGSGESFSRRKQKLNLLELIVGVLIRYPIYWDWNLRGYTTCEATILDIIESKKAMGDAYRFNNTDLLGARRKLYKINTLRKAYLPLLDFK